jgi:hypothetical protein
MHRNRSSDSILSAQRLAVMARLAASSVGLDGEHPFGPDAALEHQARPGP